MKLSNKWIVLATVGFLIILMIVGIVNAATKTSGHGSMSSSSKPTAPKDKDAFVTLWKKAQVEAKFSVEQKTKLTKELENASKKLTENYVSLKAYTDQQAKAKGDEAAKLKKRVDLKEAERDLIVSQVKMALGEFLNKDQLNLILMAGFHGVSLALSGDEHSTDMKDDKMMSKGKLDQLTMDLGEVAEKLNQNCEAVSLELIRKNL